ncbi:glycosyltransferase family 4 protein [Acidithiobacillus ferrooxidans]|uniref:glycosyltransferase family 4 protein n=1 Tax=Acidithiobacillus ferrooxidans TaxID=920 RepID=UPI0013D2E9EB|nr:glycosyltransferase family 4 protein [Acidithiobacillus ferrooxidans]MBU2858405.1 glycosyltransferase family 4 protein [Acidithiobacillus ferrooxidans]MCR2830697.1 glycosyltransferase family 4 protein [Acidithiobacillus ferrooxidans]
MNHLAAAMAEQGLLQEYIRPYANQHRTWEYALAHLPGLGRLYTKTLGRRAMPPGLARGDIREAAVWQDILRAGALHFGGARTRALVEQLHWRIQQRLAEVGGRHAQNARVIVGSYQVSHKAFARASGVKVLNYPTVHHRYIRRFVAEERELEPSFANTLPDWDQAPTWQEPELDMECEQADRILIGSQFARNTFIEEGFLAEKMVVISYGADLARFSPTPPRGEQEKIFKVLFVGNIGQRKGVSYLLRAYQAFRGPGTELVLVGSYSGDPKMMAPFRDQFTHIPHVPQSRLASIYQEAQVFVLPALLEGMGLVVLEAMASGLPVITTPNGPGDLVRDGVDGFVVPIRDVNAIVEKLEYLRAHPEERLRMGQNARERAKMFTWEQYRAKVTNFIGSLYENGLPK